jgi:hypothetical protein
MAATRWFRLILWPQDVALPAYAYQRGVSFVLATSSGNRDRLTDNGGLECLSGGFPAPLVVVLAVSLGSRSPLEKLGLGRFRVWHRRAASAQSSAHWVAGNALQSIRNGLDLIMPEEMPPLLYISGNNADRCLGVRVLTRAADAAPRLVPTRM